MGLRRWWWQSMAATARLVTRRRGPRPTEFSRLMLAVSQRGSVLRVEMTTDPGLQLTELVARDPERRRQSLGPVTATGTARAIRYAAEIDLTHLAGLFPAEHDSALDIALDVVTSSDQERLPKYAQSMGADAPADARGRLSYWAPLGRFDRTELTGITPVPLPDGRLATVRVTRHGNLAVRLGDLPPADALVSADHLTIYDGVLALRGIIDSGAGPVAGARVVVAGRGLDLAAFGPVELDADPAGTAERHGRVQYRFSGSLDLRDLIEPGVVIPPHSRADLWLEITPADGGPAVLRRVGGVPFEQRHVVEEAIVLVGDSAVEVIPYFTFKGRNPSFLLEAYSAETYRTLMRLTRPSHRENRRGAAPVWIIGERPETAQDNGYHLFRYLRAQRPDIDAYYVITADSPDRSNLAGLDHVVTFGSAQHMELTVRASRIIGTHHPEYLYPSRSRRLADHIGAALVFLQHGVMGSKWMVPNYGKFGTGFRTDLFCVSSERERDYIINDFGYEPDEVVVTGLARFDALFDDDVPVVPGQVLIAPTWRDWLTTDEAFAESDYLRLWRGLLTDPRLAALREQTGASVKLYLHSNMQRYADFFAGAGIELVEPGSVPLQYLLKQSAVLITDYSSPSFDFSFLGRPVIYFQFDRAEFFGALRSHLDLDAELPGFVAPHPDDVLRRLGQVLQPGFVLEEEYRERSARFLAHHDRRNCERITAAIEGARRRRGPVLRARQSEAKRITEQRIRTSRLYFPLMRLAYRAMKLLPMDRRTIVFESGSGKQFSDSPREIYLELIRRGDPRRRMWVYDRTPPVADPQRVMLQRLSLRYFYHLARAKYWVSNQNLPYYITRRRGGVYLQTWHGTPLKRMLHDLDQVVGRDSGYLDRVSQATAQWSHLISPSPYASEAFRSAFRFRGEMLETGYPRNDILLRDGAAQLREHVRAELGVSADQQVLLYAPTFRDDQKIGARFSFEMPFDLSRFAVEFGPDTVLLLRMHQLVSTELIIPSDAQQCVRDMSSYADIARLYLAADCLITDYSSVLFDFAITGKPLVFYPYDLDQYRDAIRGFYLDYEADLPGPIARTEDELFAALRTLADPAARAGMRSRVADFARRFAPFDDGHATERVVDAIFGR